MRKELQRSLIEYGVPAHLSEAVIRLSQGEHPSPYVARLLSNDLFGAVRWLRHNDNVSAVSKDPAKGWWALIGWWIDSPYAVQTREMHDQIKDMIRMFEERDTVPADHE